MAKKKTAKSTAESSSTTVLSVRFSEEELVQIKEAAAILSQPPATFVRESACRTAVELINAGRTPKQARALTEVAREVTQHFFGKGKVKVEEADFDGRRGGEPKVEYLPEYGTDFGELKVTPAPLGDDKLRNLTRALQHASRPFAAALLGEIEKAQAGDDDADFIPVINQG